MLISEIAFPHLVAANDDRIARDLERRATRHPAGI